jgi:DNA phosphorothioation-associated putative methyltransferase
MPEIGKKTAGGRYVHRSALQYLSDVNQERVTLVAGRFAGEWNVVRIGGDSISFLLYESFDEVAFPALLESTRFVTETGKVVRSSYRGRANPPILHRKELLLRPEDPRIPAFRALTSTAEDHGLFAQAHRIGTRAAWNARIREAGLVLRGHQLVSAAEHSVSVARHKTAIARRELSQPMQLLVRLGLATPDRSIFDYGCGQGEDVAALASQGFGAHGWDPHHAPEGARRPAGLVNLGFVLNVIEDPRERVETLRDAWRFAKEVLCVAVMVRGKGLTAGHKPYRDGFVTRRGTFQKYFEQQELRSLVLEVTGESPLTLAPGIVAAFRNKDLEQEVLLRRRSRAFVVGNLPRPPRRELPVVVRVGLRERLSPILPSMREVAIALGRLPETDEILVEAQSFLVENRISWQRALQVLRELVATDDEFLHSAELRREDLLVHLALIQFPGSPKYRSLPQSIRYDLKSFFGGHSAALEEGRRLLFAAGDREGVRNDVETAIALRIGGKRGQQHFRFQPRVLAQLPTRLRVLVGCAEVLQGGIEAYDFIEIDLEAPRVTMISCDDVERPVPFMLERVHVDLGRLKVWVDDYEPGITPIFFKSRFMAADDPARERQLPHEATLVATGLFEEGKPEPSWSQVKIALAGNIPEIRGNPAEC